MSCLAEVAAALVASKPGFGGLECNFGSLNDIITPKGSSFGGGFAETSMMLKWKKHLMPYDLAKLILLDISDWKNHIPKRLILYEDV